MFQIIVEVGLFFLIVLVGIFQVLLPLYQNRKIFPIVRKDLKIAEEKLTDAGQEVAVSNIEFEQQELKKTIKKQTTTKKGR